MYNLNFYNKNIGRYILSLKYSNNMLYNSTFMLEFSRASVFFKFVEAVDLDQLSVLSCIYFFKFYFGILPFFSNYEHRFHLNVHYYNFWIQYNFFSKYIYSTLYIFLNDIYFFLKKKYIVFYEADTFFEYWINDNSFFLEKKTSLGFFYLKHNVYFQFHFKNVLNFESINLLYLFKLSI